MSVSNNSSFSQKPYVSLKTKYEALKETNPDFARNLANWTKNKSNIRLNSKNYTKPTQYLDDINNYQESWHNHYDNNFGRTIKEKLDGKGFLIRNSSRTFQSFDNILNEAVKDLRSMPYAVNDDKIWEKRLPIKRMVVDIFGNFHQDSSSHYHYEKNKIDPLAYPTLHTDIKADYEIDPSARKYRELIAKQLTNPEHKIHSLSTEHYGVYQAHDNTKKHPHLLIIPNNKKYKNFRELVLRGTREEVKDYLKVLEKVANEGPRLNRLEHELFIIDSGELQKVPFFYTEYIPRRNEGMPEQQNPHILLKDILIGEINQNSKAPFQKLENEQWQNLSKFGEYTRKLKAEANLRENNKANKL